MPHSTLSIAERHNIDNGSWFAKLSPTLRGRLVVLSREKLPALSEQV